MGLQHYSTTTEHTWSLGFHAQHWCIYCYMAEVPHRYLGSWGMRIWGLQGHPGQQVKTQVLEKNSPQNFARERAPGPQTEYVWNTMACFPLESQDLRKADHHQSRLNQWSSQAASMETEVSRKKFTATESLPQVPGGRGGGGIQLTENFTRSFVTGDKVLISSQKMFSKISCNIYKRL